MAKGIKTSIAEKLNLLSQMSNVVMQVTKEMFDVYNFLNASDPNQRERRKYLGKFIDNEFIFQKQDKSEATQY